MARYAHATIVVYQCVGYDDVLFDEEAGVHYQAGKVPTITLVGPITIPRFTGEIKAFHHEYDSLNKALLNLLREPEKS